MDRSVDSIGSCSLDVDADSDVSDTSGSLNFPTPISIKDVTREFTANIKERCSARMVQNSTTAILDPVTEKVRMVVTQPTSDSRNIIGAVSSTVGDESRDKKPSYLNLACCVNGYSNLTTYDSKIRQEINKSREVSPIRPSSSSLQYCKKNNSLAPPVLHAMPDAKKSKIGRDRTKYVSMYEANNNVECGNDVQVGGGDHRAGSEKGHSPSFIQQRVERLYGPGALAQGFYSPKKNRGSSLSPQAVNSERKSDGNDMSELAKKFQEMSPGKDFSEFRKRLEEPASSRIVQRQSPLTKAISSPSNDGIDLPCFRHLSQEFRAQLPAISPKKQLQNASLSVGKNSHSQLVGEEIDVVDHRAITSSLALAEGMTPSDIIPQVKTNGKNPHAVIATESGKHSSVEKTREKDGTYFLHLLKAEQARLLGLSSDAEKYIDALANNPDIGEDILGLLRSASGKARLLATQKMKQFEGLCHNNLNRSPEDKFPTTVDDLQGFWDMVYLQVDNVNAIFAEIEALKRNDWKKPNVATPPRDAINSTKSQNQTKNKSRNVNGNGPNANAGKSPTATPSRTTKSAAALKREAQRKEFMEMKRKNKMAMNSSNTPIADDCPSENAGSDPVEIFVKNTTS